MTHQDDPKLRRLDPVRQVPQKDNTGMWIAGLIGLCLVLALVVWGVSRNTSGTATTTGAVPSALPNNSTGTTPQRATNQPPAPSPSPNR